MQRGIELIEGPTWLLLRRYLEKAGLSLSECFFTNVFVGLQPSKSVGKMNGGAEYERQCRAFLHKQIDLVRPRLVATLGKPAAQQYRQSGCSVPTVALDHPYYAYAKGVATPACQQIIDRNAATLQVALDAIK